MGCIIRENLFLLNSDSSQIQQQGIKNLQQAVDRHAQTIASSALSSNPPPSNIPSSAFISESYFLQCTKIAENHATVTTIEEDDSGADTLAITHSKAKNAVLNSIDTKNPKEVTSLSSNSRTHTQAPPVEISPPDIPPTLQKKTPTYSYESKAAIPDAASRIYQTMLDTAVPNITIADLLAVSPDLR
ncbi:hypothetical protein BDR04DRAFT_1158790 [Suillus decipiens]|nr:hypothetical protein BDR04DRAFT_1158790 [Suillus decipiens]